MSMRSPAKPGVTGDFLFAIGPGADACTRAMKGFDVVSDGDARIAVRGAVQQGTAADGTRWLAIADLIEGDLADGVTALEPNAVPQRRWRGRFAQIVWRANEQRVAALTDHFSTLSIHVLQRDGTLVLATDLRLIARSGLSARQADPVAIYHYLNFGCIPAPYTICRDIRRLLPGARMFWSAGRGTDERYFVSEYPEDISGSDADLAKQLRERMIDSVHAYRPDDARAWGCFLSGGTDSSSIVSILASQRPETRVRTFSIGFAEQGYDELGYAQLVADTCHADAYSSRVDRNQAVAMVAQVVDAYDQPFGDASAIPTMACAALADEHGVDTLLAGDGGDEIFGGNERYAKDQVMEAFYRLPAPLKSVGNAIGRMAGRSSLHLLNRVQNFVERASLPNPDRFYTNDSFGSDYYSELLQADFRAEVDRDASLAFMREVHAFGGAASPLHRIMRLDLYMAIAQNDLVKVEGACRAHSISTRFPYLDPTLVDYTGRLETRCKVRGLSKRHLFKQATAGILPDAVLHKKKQGFGLPIAVWLRSDPAFQQMVRDVLFEPRTLSRGLFDPGFVESLIAEHIRGSWDHSSGIWQLLILELWLRKYLDAS